VTLSSADGGSTSTTLTLPDSPEPETFAIHASDVTNIRFTLESAYLAQCACRCTGSPTLRSACPRPRRLRLNRPGATQRFFTAGLGFKISDEAPGLASFLRCSTDHHNVLVQQAPVSFLHHTAWEVDDVDASHSPFLSPPAELARIISAAEQRSR
jgi:hypothetical protein